jgi:CRP/FNR family transcriptional regulator, cyclic AMP receptor protein
MYATSSKALAPPDIKNLIQAMQQSPALDAVRLQLSPPNWDILAGHLQPFSMDSGQILFERGAMDRTLYLVESGTLSAHYEDKKSRLRMAMVGAGSVLGEGAFFSHEARNATVQASSACRLWTLTPTRFTDLATRHSPIALELIQALGAVIAKRLYNRLKRPAVT